jgi:nucleotide-binding universal stress UspA family protein
MVGSGRVERAFMYKHILIPTDGSELSEKAVKHGIAIAKETKAEITGIMVSMPFYVFASDPDVLPQELYEKSTTSFANKCLNELKNTAEGVGVPCNIIHVEHTQPYQGILDAAKQEGCDLIVMASHGRRGISAIVLGSETVKVLTHSSIPVLVYR